MTTARTNDHAAPTVRRRERPRPLTETTARGPSPVSEQSYEVGYGRPPKHSQFPPGQSGNPKGRPKGAKSISTVLREEALSRVALRENGKLTSLTKLEAAIKRLFSDALSGKVTPMKLLLPLLLNAEAQDATMPDDRELSHEDKELVRNLLKGFADE